MITFEIRRKLVNKMHEANLPSRNARSDSDRRLQQAARLADHLQLLQLLLGRARWDYESLATEFECSTRTIRRRLETLELAGVPWVYDRLTKSIRVRPGVKFPVLQLTRDELLQQATATTVTKAQGLDAAASDVAIQKLAALSSDNVAETLNDAARIMEALDLKLADHGKHHEALKTVQWALIERKQMVGKYKSPYQADFVQLALHPIRLCLTGQAWYLIAKTEPEGYPKTYRIARFHHIRLLDAAAEVPEEFDLEDYFGNAWSVFRGKDRFEVDLLFTPDAAELVAETNWHKTQQVLKHDDGSATLKFSIDGLDEILWWVLGWSGRVTVRSPDELRWRVTKQSQAAIDMNR